MPNHLSPSHTHTAAAAFATPDRLARTHLSTTAPSRGLSPSRRQFSPLASTATSPSPKMPSPRASPALRPSSPLTPRFDSGPRYEALQLPSPRALHPRSAAAATSQRRHNTGSLQLPSLPRFHPANFPSQHSSAATTPAAGLNSPQPPASPIAQQKLYSDVQKQLYLYQRETIAANGGKSTVREKPLSPRLAPLGSPGPVTPLELEGQEGYLLAGAHAAARHDMSSRSGELMEKLIEEEVRRNHNAALASQDSSPVLDL